MKRQVSKKKLLAWLEENKKMVQQEMTISFDQLEIAILDGELDMVKDWRLNKNEM